MTDRYSIVGCKHCRSFTVVDGNPKTTQCPQCEKRLNFQKLKKLFTTDDADEAAQVRGLFLARQSGQEEVITELIESGVLTQEVEAAVSDTELLEAHGVDVDDVEDAATGQTKTRTPSQEEIVREAVETVEHPTLQNIGAYAAEEYGKDSEKIQRIIEKLYQKGDVTRAPDGTYSYL